MTLPPPIANLLKIKTDNEEIRQKSRFAQIIILVLLGAWVLLTVIAFTNFINNPGKPTDSAYVLAVLLLSPIVALGGLWLARNGRSALAAHLTFIYLNSAIFLYIVQANEPRSIPYLMLISIVAIATMVSIRASILYAILITISISSFYVYTLPHPDYIDAIINFILLTFSLGLIAWLTANRTQKWLREATQLSRQMAAQTDQLQTRNQHLQQSAAVGQSISNLMDYDLLLTEIVNTIHQQFSPNFTAIFLLNPAGTHLTIAEASSDIGKVQKLQIALDSQSILSRAAQKQKTQLLHNQGVDPAYVNIPSLKETKSQAVFPLVARGKLLGVLDIQSNLPHAFQDEDMTILQIMVNQFAINLENARLFSQTQSYLAETQSLLNLSAALTSTMDVGEIYRRSARIFSTQLQANITLITDWNQLNDIATSQIFFTLNPDPPSSEFNSNPFAFPLAHFPFLGTVLAQQEVSMQSIHDTAITKAEENFFETHKQAYCLMVPLAHGSKPIGCVLTFRAADQTEFTPSDIQVAQVMANETAIALNNAKSASEARGRAAQLSALNRLSNRLSLAPTMRQIFEGTRQEVLSLFEATGLTISLITKDEQHMCWIYGYEYGQELELPTHPLPISTGFSGQVARSRRHLLINENLWEKSEQYKSFNVGVKSAAWLGVPLIVANKIIGVLAIENEHDPLAFDERDINLLETIAGSTAIALSNQLQLEELQSALTAQSEQRLQLQTAAEVSAATISILDLDELLEEAVSLIKERFSLYYTGIFLSDLATNQAVLKAATGEAGRIQLENGHKLTIGGRSLIGGATGDGRSRITQDVTQDEEWRPNIHLPDTRSELALPLNVRGEIIGAVTVQSTEAHAFSPELVSTLQTMSDQLATAIDNSRLLAAAESRVKRQKLLNQISTQLHNTADTNEIIRIGLKALSKQVNGRSVNIALGKPGTQTDS
ncbi:MAG: hypothetical protein CSB13_10305 [Chloroflexi bacterium]|nr:MAG: hypothetical protein CSB13_10305 [Chloroflexota bacterium]